MNSQPLPSSTPTESQRPRPVFYCRMPDLLVQAVRQAQTTAERHLPLAVTEGRTVRSACPRAASGGVRAGQGVVQARRLCPALVTVPLEAVHCQAYTSAFLDALADLSPAVEPDGPDAAYMVLPCQGTGDVRRTLASLSERFDGLVTGSGASRLAARACAESALPPERLTDAGVDWLWPEDAKLVAALKRLGLETFSQVAAVGEAALFYQFGRIGRLLHRRALGQDFTPVRPLYPPPRADASRDLSEYPVTDRAALEAAIDEVSAAAADELRALGRHGRRMVLRVATEAGEQRQEWVLPAPLQSAGAVRGAALRLLSRMPITAAVTGVRLLVEDLETPTARTADLFLRGPGDDPAALQALRRSLQARFGTKSIMMVSQRPRTVREERRACLHEKWAGGR